MLPLARPNTATSHILCVLANVALALALVFGYVPLAAFCTVGVAWADEGGGDGDGDDEEARQREEAERKAREDQAQADAVIALIDALPAATSATGSDLPMAESASQAYDALSADQKALVPAEKKTKLDAVVAAATAAKQAEEQQQDDHQGGSSGGSEDPGGEGDWDDPGGSGDSEGPGDDPYLETYYVKTLLLKWDKPDENDVTHFVGDASIVERAYRQVSITEFGETVQLNGYYLSTDETGVAYQTADGSTAIGSFELTWRSSDESVAQVTPTGLVRPQGKNGEVTITATVADPRVYEGEAPTATVTIVFDGQDGKYVKKVEILDEDGNNIGQKWGGVTVYAEENAFHQLHARVTWCNVEDGSETVEITGSGEDYDAHSVGTTLTWSVSASDAFTINKDTGRLRCGSYSGNAFVTCAAVGGLGGKEVIDTANVQLDTGVYEYNPSDSLTLKVVWEERPDEVVKEATFTYEELLGALATRHVNATVVNGSRYGVISADGFLFKDVVDLVAVDDADVLQYRFSTADGYDNPVSYQYLFESGNRYYFPNYDLGGSRAEGQIVPPVLAYQSSFEWDRSEANPSAQLSDGTRFRLVFGCLASGDANTSFQIYYINGITIVLKGAPPAGDDSGTDDSGSNPDDAPTGTDEGDNGGWDDVGSGGTGGKPGSGDQGGTGTGGGNSQGPLEGTDGNGQREAGSERSSAQGQNSSDNADEGSNDDDSAAGGDTGSAKRWRVYQMMNKTNSDVPDWDDENPMSPFALPVMAGAFAVGIGATGVGFRRRLK